MPYNLYPAVDSTYNFPPQVREALAGAQEITDAIKAEGDTLYAPLSQITRKIGTNAQRLALVSAAMFDGLEWWCTDTRLNWLRINNQWVVKNASGYVVKDVTQNGTTSAAHITWAASQANIKHDDAGFFSTTATDTINFPYTGRYKISANIGSTGIPARNVHLFTRAGGTGTPSSVLSVGAVGAAGAPTTVTISEVEVYVTAGDNAYLDVTDAAAGSSLFSCWLRIEYLGLS